MPLARLPLGQAGTVDGRHWLVVRRCLDDPDELAYYLVWAPPETPLPTMVQAIGGRWRIEEDLQEGLALGLDHYEVRSAPSLVSPSHPGLAGLRLPRQPHGPEPSHGFGLWGGSGLLPTHRALPLRSPSRGFPISSGRPPLPLP